MNILEKIKFKYKLFIPAVLTIAILALFFFNNYRLSSFIENQLISMNKKEIKLNSQIHTITNSLADLQNSFIEETISKTLDKKKITIANQKFNIITMNIQKIAENPQFQSYDRKEIIKKLIARIDGFHAILMEFPEELEESSEDGIYAIVALNSISTKMMEDLEKLQNISKKLLNEKIISIETMVSQNRESTIFSTILFIIFLSITSFFINKEIISSITTLKNINHSFLNFLNKKSDSVEKISHFPNDEIGEVLRLINNNIEEAQKLITQDRLLTNEINRINESLAQRVQNSIQEISNLNVEIEDTQREVIFTMGSIGESRSKETGNHVKRVAEYSKLLALLYGLDEKEADLLKEASPMHDIGKVAIPDHILNKPAKLTKEEFCIMQTHASLGYEMLKHSNRTILKTAAIIAHQHHEKYNGKGYPHGLKGDEIHIYGSITAIADVFDALGSDRVYKKAWSLEKILNLFREERGEQFHPELTDLFLENIDKFLAIKDKFEDIPILDQINA